MSSKFNIGDRVFSKFIFGDNKEVIYKATVLEVIKKINEEDGTVSFSCILNQDDKSIDNRQPVDEGNLNLLVEEE